MTGKEDGHQRNKVTSSRTATYPVSRLAPSFDLIDIAKQISEGDRIINVKASSKLQVIADQIKLLQAEARKILAQAQHDQLLNRAECNFRRMPGKTYHLYEKENGRLYFSMLSPEEWGGATPHAHKGGFRFENDHSWTPVETLAEEDAQHQAIQRLMASLD